MYFSLKVAMEDLQPELSIIIPIYHSSQRVVDTCESLLSQKGVRWEAVFVDAGVELHASEIIKSYQDKRLRVQALTQGSLYALMNRGVLMAQGEYVNLLLEGCTYLAPSTLAVALQSIREQKEPDLFYTASYVGDNSGNWHLYYTLDWASMLKKGFQPALLQSCFFKTSMFKKLGLFDQNLDRRGALDFFARLYIHPEVRVASEMRVYVEMNQFPRQLLGLWVIFKETYKVIYHHFGLRAVLKLIFSKQTLAAFLRRYPLDLVIPG